MLDGLFGGTEKLPVYTDKNANKYQGITETETYSPQTEVMRFFTSFGAGHFNDLRVINVITSYSIHYTKLYDFALQQHIYAYMSALKYSLLPKPQDDYTYHNHTISMLHILRKVI